MQKVRQIFLWLLFILNFIFFFTPFWGFFSDFLYSTLRYRLIKIYLSLEGGPPIFKLDFTCPVLLSLLYPFFKGFPYVFIEYNLLAFFVFAHHYSRNLCYFLFLLLLRCFTSQSFSLSFSLGYLIFIWI